MTMKGERKNKILGAFLASAVIALVVVVALTVAGELYKPLKDWLMVTFNHHWIGKSVLSFAGFYVLGFLFIPFFGKGERAVTVLLHTLFWTAVVGALILLGLFYYETFLAVRG